FLFEKSMGNIVFLEGKRRFLMFQSAPPRRKPLNIRQLWRENAYAREYFQNSNTRGISSFLRAIIDFSACSHSGNGFAQLGFAAPHFPEKMQIRGHHHAGTQMHARREIYFIREVVSH